jgi:hypothetical protein
MPDHPHSDLKAKAREELVEFVTVALYLLLVLGAFTIYRRLVLSEFGVSQWKYGFAVIEALVLGKIVLIGEAIGVGRFLQGRALAWAALYKALAFSLLVLLFSLAEHAIEGAVHHESLAEAIRLHGAAARDEALARALMMFVAFVPFFALTDLRRRYGLPDLGRLFFGSAPKP